MSRPSFGADLRSLARADWPVFFAAWVLLPLTELGFRAAGLARTRRVLSWFVPARRALRDRAEHEEHIRRVARAVSLASRHVLPEPGCVPDSLVLSALLRRRGVATEVRIGVRRHRETLHAHAWVEHGGQPIGRTGLQAAHYSAFERPVAGE